MCRVLSARQLVCQDEWDTPCHSLLPCPIYPQSFHTALRILGYMAYKTPCDQPPDHPSNFSPVPLSTAFTMVQLYRTKLEEIPGSFHLRDFRLLSSTWGDALPLTPTYLSISIEPVTSSQTLPPNKLCFISYSFSKDLTALTILRNEISVYFFAFQLPHTTARLRRTRIRAFTATTMPAAPALCSACCTENVKTKVLNKYSQCLQER